MTEPRAYRPAKPESEAAHELRAERLDADADTVATAPPPTATTWEETTTAADKTPAAC